VIEEIIEEIETFSDIGALYKMGSSIDLEI
jgi:hypothetical protein